VGEASTASASRCRNDGLPLPFVSSEVETPCRAQPRPVLEHPRPPRGLASRLRSKRTELDYE
jgi:hypothetical protein